jgi:2-polyprenyl-3-methyl-5-hydroxy-6-metoxy-1,4-benzoquinol methylase
MSENSAIGTERTSECPACGDHRNQLWATARDRLYRSTDQEFEYSRCTDCGSLFQSLRPLESDVYRCYTSAYGPHASKHAARTLSHLPASINAMLDRLSRRIVRMDAFSKWMKSVEKKLVAAGNILDFGCGSGKYLDRARKLGCSTLGMDFSGQALAEAARRGHETLDVSEASWSLLAGRRFGFARLNHVVEHLYRPRETLSRVYDALEPQGVIHISTPNPDGPSSGSYGSAWWGLECPRHIVLIPPAQLVKLLESIGFTSIEVMQEPVVKDFVRSWAYTRVDRGALSNECVEGLAGDGLLSCLFALRFRLKMDKTGQADRYHIVARK